MAPRRLSESLKPSQDGDTLGQSAGSVSFPEFRVTRQGLAMSRGEPSTVMRALTSFLRFPCSPSAGRSLVPTNLPSARLTFASFAPGTGPARNSFAGVAGTFAPAPRLAGWAWEAAPRSGTGGPTRAFVFFGVRGRDGASWQAGFDLTGKSPVSRSVLWSLWDD